MNTAKTLGLYLLTSSSALFAQNQVGSSAWTPTANTPSLVWYPSRSALRFGEVSSAGTWAATQIGDHSFAGGTNAVAGNYAWAFGNGATATVNAFAFGINSNAGDFSLAFGTGTNADYAGLAVGSSADASFFGIALGQGAMTTDWSVAIGAATIGSGVGSVAIGGESSAFGDYSLVFGITSASVGDAAIALGFGATAIADASITIGHSATSSSIGGVALGKLNSSSTKAGGTPDPVVASPGDPVLMVGKGVGSTRANALTVYRDGDIHATGAIRVPQRGNLSMGGFQAKPAGVAYP